MPSPSKVHRFPAKWLSLGLTLAVTLLFSVGNPLLDVLERKTYDMRLLSLPPNPPRDVAIVAIDEKSLLDIGRWPWSRETQARIAERLIQLGAQVVAFDIVYPEAEGKADERLRKLIAENERIVLSMFLLFNEDEVRHISTERNANTLELVKQHDVQIVRQSGGGKTAAILEAKAIIANIPLLQSVSKYTGHIDAIPDDDGGLRTAALVIPYKGHFFPSGDVQAVRAFTGGNPLILRMNNEGVEGLEVANNVISTDPRGRAYIRYYGPQQTVPTFSASDVLQPAFDANLIKNRIVLFGPTAKGLGDIRVTPFAPDMPGVEVRATIAQNLLRNDFIRRPYWATGLDVVALALLGIVLSFVLPRLKLLTATAVVTGVLALYVGLGFYLFHQHRFWLTLTYPALLLVVLFVSTVLVQYFLTESDRKRIKSAFQYYLHPKLVDELTQDIDKLKLGGAKQELTVFFSDIRGFTTTTETLPPEELVHMLNQYFTRMTADVFKYDGYLDKYIGDAVMAVYGAPIPRADHAVRACHSALDMMKDLRELQVQWASEGRPGFDIGIGINTGSMIVGNMGSEDRFNYTVIGDAVNLGSRIESLNKNYGTHILISEYTYEKAKEVYAKQLREVDITQVKGRGQSVRIYELIPEGAYADLDWLPDYRRAYRQLRTGEIVNALATFEKLAETVNDPVSRYHVANAHKR